jgi:hypothetical protein
VVDSGLKAGLKDEKMNRFSMAHVPDSIEGFLAPNSEAARIVGANNAAKVAKISGGCRRKMFHSTLQDHGEALRKMRGTYPPILMRSENGIP